MCLHFPVVCWEWARGKEIGLAPSCSSFFSNPPPISVSQRQKNLHKLSWTQPFPSWTAGTRQEMGIKLYKWKLWKAETQHVPVESKRPSPNRDFSNSWQLCRWNCWSWNPSWISTRNSNLLHWAVNKTLFTVVIIQKLPEGWLLSWKEAAVPHLWHFHDPEHTAEQFGFLLHHQSQGLYTRTPNVHRTLLMLINSR